VPAGSGRHKTFKKNANKSRILAYLGTVFTQLGDCAGAEFGVKLDVGFAKRGAEPGEFCNVE